eukprot:GHVO01038548.1.p1 GENE.GHVO01038548.1~~GHVO01038548.1.p1  ORF type:complete len:223 (-),score=28.16 GHVO01038548.1:88-708(-)
MYDPLIMASKEATQAGLKAAGIDAIFDEVGGVIEEVISSYEVEIKGKTYKVKPVRNLSGHTIEPYKIHAGKSLPIIANGDMSRMEEGEVYAIETFATTGKGFVNEDGECSHYARLPDVRPQLRLKAAKSLLHGIDQHFGSLPFCRRWLDDIGMTRTGVCLKSLVDAGAVQDYPPLVDAPWSFVSQSEHTIVMRPTCKEVVSRGDDY